MFVFRKIWRAWFSSNTRFEIRPFALLPTKYFILQKTEIRTQKFTKIDINGDKFGCLKNQKYGHFEVPYSFSTQRIHFPHKRCWYQYNSWRLFFEH